MLTFRQMEYFLKLCETLNFARAAEELYTTQPSVTRQIQALERELEVPLFQRTSRKVELTPTGSYLQKEFRRLLDQMNEAIQTARKMELQLAGELRIGVCDLWELPFLPEAMRQFRTRHPDVFLQLKVDCFRSLIQKFQSEDLDLIFCMRSPAAAVSGAERRRMRRGRLCCIVPKGSPLARCERLTPEDVAAYPWIFRESRHSTPPIAHLQLRLKTRWPDHPILYSPSPAQSALMVQAGFGICFVVDYSVPLNPGYQLVPFFLSPPEPQENLDLIALWRLRRNFLLSREFAALSEQIQTGLERSAGGPEFSKMDIF